jgi:four helix bundle protein
MPYHNLEVYKKAYNNALDVHKMTMKLPKLEQYELGSQLRRSSKSIVVNIVEGMGDVKVVKQKLYISYV